MQSLRSQKKWSLHGANEYFFDKRNAVGGNYGRALKLGKGCPVKNETALQGLVLGVLQF